MFETSDPPRAADRGRPLVHRLNNFLTLCMTHADGALDSRRPEEMQDALQWILEGAQRMADYLQALPGPCESSFEALEAPLPKPAVQHALDGQDDALSGLAPSALLASTSTGGEETQ